MHGVTGGRGTDPFWERSDVVERFAERDPDVRLEGLLAGYERPEAARALDLGCAGGRNAVLLARHGFDVRAVDASAAMVERTRARLAAVVGPEAARERVRVGRMDDLSAFADGSFDLVVALGVYHNARSAAEWERALAETARVLDDGARLLVSHFTPEVDLTGEGVRPVPGEPGVYDGFPGGRVVLLDRPALDAAVARHGLRPEVASETVRVEREEGGRRVSVNALYRRLHLLDSHRTKEHPMPEQTTRYGIGATIPLPYQRAVERTREELGKEGFGVLSEIDIAGALKEKLGVDFRPYVILGACNPPLAHQALTAERDIGLLLPCNVIVYAADRDGHSVVAAMDPVEALELTGNDAIRPLADEVRERLQRVLAGLEEG